MSTRKTSRQPARKTSRRMRPNDNEAPGPQDHPLLAPLMRRDAEDKALLAAAKGTKRRIEAMETIRSGASDSAGRALADLSGIDLSGIPIDGLNLSRCNLRGANFSTSDLRFVIFNGSDLTGADLSRAVLLGPSLENATLTRANLDRVTFNKHDDIDGAISGGIVGVPKQLPSRTQLLNGYLIGRGANLSGADLRDADLRDADLSYANLTGANLSGAILPSRKASLYSARTGDVVGVPSFIPDWLQLIGGCLIGPGVDLGGADLSGLDLSGVDLTGVSLVGANITGTGLEGATLRGASTLRLVGQPSTLPAGWRCVGGYLLGPAVEIIGADLPGADLRNASLAGAKLPRSDLRRADLRRADLRRTKLTRARLQRSDLRGARMGKAALGGADLTNAKLDGVDLRGVIADASTKVSLPWAVVGSAVIGPGTNPTDVDFSDTDLSKLDHHVDVLSLLRHGATFDWNTTWPDWMEAPASAKPRSPLSSPDFRRWFGSSKAVDANGEPVVMYHGTGKGGFTAFDLSKIDGHHHGFFFTSSREVARSYVRTPRPHKDPLSLLGTRNPGRIAGIYEVYLRMENPFVIDVKGAQWHRIPFDVTGTGKRGARANTDDISLYAKKHGHDSCAILNVRDYGGSLVESATFKQALALEAPDDIYVVFSPAQVKSAFLNSGAYDPNDPDLRKNPRRTNRRKTSHRARKTSRR